MAFKVAPELLFAEANLEGFACFRVTRFKSVFDERPWCNQLGRLGEW